MEGMAWGCNDIGLLLLFGSLVLFALSFGYSTTFFFYLYFLSPTGSKNEPHPFFMFSLQIINCHGKLQT